MEKFGLLALQGGSGGDGLPPVTNADNGKDLSVVNGAWSAVMKDPLVVTYIINGAAVRGNYPLSADHTFAEIVQAWGSGREIVARLYVPSVGFLRSFLANIVLDDDISSPTYDEPLTVVYGNTAINVAGSVMTGMVGSIYHNALDSCIAALDTFPLSSQFDYDSTTHTLTLNL